MSGTAGASRMSSVRGLNARPHTAIRLPLQRAEMRLELVEQPELLPLVDGLDGVEDRRSRSASAAANRSIAFTSFGKQLPP